MNFDEKFQLSNPILFKREEILIKFFSFLSQKTAKFVRKIEENPDLTLNSGRNPVK